MVRESSEAPDRETTAGAGSPVSGDRASLVAWAGEAPERRQVAGVRARASAWAGQ